MPAFSFALQNDAMKPLKPIRAQIPRSRSPAGNEPETHSLPLWPLPLWRTVAQQLTKMKVADKKGTYEDYVGRAGLQQLGKTKWRRHVADVVARLIIALEPDETVIGGGNVKKLAALPPHARAGDNANAFRGGFRLWQFDSGPEKDHTLQRGPSDAVE
jgi:hypothetical protein